LRNRTFYQTVSNTEKRGDAAMYIMRNLKCVLTLDACNPILIDARSKWELGSSTGPNARFPLWEEKRYGNVGAMTM